MNHELNKNAFKCSPNCKNLIYNRELYDFYCKKYKRYLSQINGVIAIEECDEK